MVKRLIVITLAALAILTLGFDTSTMGKSLTGGGKYAFWDNQGSILFVDSTATRDTAYFWGFHGCDSIRVYVKVVGAAVADDDSLFILQYTMDWYGTMTLVDTLMKGDDADSASNINHTYYSAQSRLSPGIALVLKQVGTANKPDTVQVVVSPVETY